MSMSALSLSSSFISTVKHETPTHSAVKIDSDNSERHLRTLDPNEEIPRLNSVLFTNTPCKIVPSKLIHAVKGKKIPTLINPDIQLPVIQFTLFELLGYIHEELSICGLFKESPWLVGGAASFVMSGLPFADVDITYYIQENESLRKERELDELDFVQNIVRKFVRQKLQVTNFTPEVIEELIDTRYLVKKTKRDGFVYYQVGGVDLKFALNHNSRLSIASSDGFHVQIFSDNPKVCCLDGKEWCNQKAFEEALYNLKCRKLILRDAESLMSYDEPTHDLAWRITQRLTQGYKIETADRLSIEQLSELAFQQIIRDYPCNSPEAVQRFYDKVASHQNSHYPDNSIGKIVDFINLLSFINGGAKLPNAKYQEERKIYSRLLAKYWKAHPIPHTFPGAISLLEPLVNLIEKNPELTDDLLAIVKGFYLRECIKPETYFYAYTADFAESPYTPRQHVAIPTFTGNPAFLNLNATPVDIARDMLMSWRKLERHYSEIGCGDNLLFQKLAQGLGFNIPLLTKDFRIATTSELAWAFTKPPFKNILDIQYKNFPNVSTLNFFTFLKTENMEGVDPEHLAYLTAHSKLILCLKNVWQANPLFSTLIHLLGQNINELRTGVSAEVLSKNIKSLIALFRQIEQTNGISILSSHGILTDIFNEILLRIIQQVEKHASTHAVQCELADLVLDLDRFKLLSSSNRLVIENVLQYVFNAKVWDNKSPAYLQCLSLMQVIQQEKFGFSPALSKLLNAIEALSLGVEQQKPAALQNVGDLLDHADEMIWPANCPEALRAKYKQLLLNVCEQIALNENTSHKDYILLQNIILRATQLGFLKESQTFETVATILKNLKTDNLSKYPKLLLASQSFLVAISQWEGIPANLQTLFGQIGPVLVEEAAAAVQKLLSKLHDEGHVELLAKCLNMTFAASPEFFAKHKDGLSLACKRLIHCVSKKTDPFFLRLGYEIVKLTYEKFDYGTEPEDFIELLGKQLINLPRQKCADGIPHKTYLKMGLNLLAQCGLKAASKAQREPLRSYLIKFFVDNYLPGCEDFDECVQVFLDTFSTIDRESIGLSQFLIGFMRFEKRLLAPAVDLQKEFTELISFAASYKPIGKKEREDYDKCIVASLKLIAEKHPTLFHFKGLEKELTCFTTMLCEAGVLWRCADAWTIFFQHTDQASKIVMFDAIVHYGVSQNHEKASVEDNLKVLEWLRKEMVSKEILNFSPERYEILFRYINQISGYLPLEQTEKLAKEVDLLFCMFVEPFITKHNKSMPNLIIVLCQIYLKTKKSYWQDKVELLLKKYHVLGDFSAKVNDILALLKAMQSSKDPKLQIYALMSFKDCLNQWCLNKANALQYPGTMPLDAQMAEVIMLVLTGAMQTALEQTHERVDIFVLYQKARELLGAYATEELRSRYLHNFLSMFKKSIPRSDQVDPLYYYFQLLILHVEECVKYQPQPLREVYSEIFNRALNSTSTWDNEVVGLLEQANFYDLFLNRNHPNALSVDEKNKINDLQLHCEYVRINQLCASDKCQEAFTALKSMLSLVNKTSSSELEWFFEAAMTLFEKTYIMNLLDPSDLFREYIVWITKETSFYENQKIVALPLAFFSNMLERALFYPVAIKTHAKHLLGIDNTVRPYAKEDQNYLTTKLDNPNVTYHDILKVVHMVSVPDFVRLAKIGLTVDILDSYFILLKEISKHPLLQIEIKRCRKLKDKKTLSPKCIQEYILLTHLKNAAIIPTKYYSIGLAKAFAIKLAAIIKTEFSSDFIAIFVKLTKIPSCPIQVVKSLQVSKKPMGFMGVNQRPENELKTL